MVGCVIAMQWCTAGLMCWFARTIVSLEPCSLLDQGFLRKLANAPGTTSSNPEFEFDVVCWKSLIEQCTTSPADPLSIEIRTAQINPALTNDIVPLTATILLGMLRHIERAGRHGNNQVSHFYERSLQWNWSEAFLLDLVV